MPESVITIFGTGKTERSSEDYKLAYQVGMELGRAGYAIANGGYGGTMEASAKAASQAGAEVIGVTCSAFKRGSANVYVSREIVTANLAERLNKLVELGDGYVVLPGGTGTLLELARVWELKNKGFPAANKPIIIVGQFWKPLLDLVATEDSEAVACIRLAAGAKEVVDILGETV